MVTALQVVRTSFLGPRPRFFWRAEQSWLLLTMHGLLIATNAPSLNRNKSLNQKVFLSFFTAIKCACSPLPILSTNEIPTLSYTWSLEKVTLPGWASPISSFFSFSACCWFVLQTEISSKNDPPFYFCFLSLFFQSLFRPWRSVYGFNFKIWYWRFNWFRSTKDLTDPQWFVVVVLPSKGFRSLPICCYFGKGCQKKCARDNPER